MKVVKKLLVIKSGIFPTIPEIESYERVFPRLNPMKIVTKYKKTMTLKIIRILFTS